MNVLLKRLVMLSMILGLSMTAYAADEDKDTEEDGEGPAVLERPIYVPVKPAFVVNYGGAGKLKYLKLEISLRVIDTNASNAARHHMPLIRDALVKLFSRQTDADIDTQEGKEMIRIAALENVKQILLEEDGEEGVTNLFFNNFVIQR